MSELMTTIDESHSGERRLFVKHRAVCPRCGRSELWVQQMSAVEPSFALDLPEHVCKPADRARHLVARSLRAVARRVEPWRVIE